MSTSFEWFLASALLILAAVVWVFDLRKKRAKRELRKARFQALDQYLALTPGEFEQALAFLCRRDDCQTASVVGGAGDLGADVVAQTADGRKIVIQAKHYLDRPVDSAAVQTFHGTCFAHHRADVALMVTTSRFTEPAQRFAATYGIQLIDFSVLADWVNGRITAPWNLHEPL